MWKSVACFPGDGGWERPSTCKAIVAVGWRPRYPGEGRFRRFPCPAPPAASLRPPCPAGPDRPGGAARSAPAAPRPPAPPRTNPCAPRCPWCWARRSPRSARLARCPKRSLESRRLGGVPGGGGSSPGLPSPPGDAVPPGDAQTALIKKLNTAAAATASSSTSSPAPFHRYSAALLSSPALHALNPGAWKLPAKHYVRCIGKGRAGAAAERSGAGREQPSSSSSAPRPGRGLKGRVVSAVTEEGYPQEGLPPSRARCRRAGPVEPRWVRRERCSPGSSGQVSHAGLSAACWAQSLLGCARSVAPGPPSSSNRNNY